MQTQTLRSCESLLMREVWWTTTTTTMTTSLLMLVVLVIWTRRAVQQTRMAVTKEWRSVGLQHERQRCAI